MIEFTMEALDPTDPLGFMAALGVLRVLSRSQAGTRLQWRKEGSSYGVITSPSAMDVTGVLMSDTERWRKGMPAADFAVGAERKVQDLKHPPPLFRAWMREVQDDPEVAAFVAAYATGVAVDGSGQTKPTSLHLTAGQQRFMDAILSLRDEVTVQDLEEALHGPWIGRVGPKDPRWRAASRRERAYLHFNPGTTDQQVIPGAAWLAYLAMPLFPVVPQGPRATTTAFGGRGKNEHLTWPVWSIPLGLREVRSLLGLPGLERMDAFERRERGIAAVLRSEVTRNPQGYGNFSASAPL